MQAAKTLATISLHGIITSNTSLHMLTIINISYLLQITHVYYTKLYFLETYSSILRNRQKLVTAARLLRMQTTECVFRLTFILLMWRIEWAPNISLIYIQQDVTSHSLFISGNCSTCFGWYFHPSSGAHTTVSTASGICHTVTAICRYRGRVGTTLPR
jgi:hypothetical protein